MDLQNNCTHAYEESGEIMCDISELTCRFQTPRTNCNLTKPNKENIKRRKEKFI